jgi:transcriptional regulator with XRE-family HTH domain
MPQIRVSDKMPNNKKNTKPPYIPERVVELRKKFGFSQKDIAEQLGVTSQAVYQAEKYNSSLLFEVIIFFSIKYGINPAWVIFEDNSNITQLLTSKEQDNSVDNISIESLILRIKSDAAMLEKILVRNSKAAINKKAVKKKK